jgi:Glycosyltransferase family 9 (heptosyltransferase)
LVLAAQPRIGSLVDTLAVVDRAVDFESLGLAALFEDEPEVGPEPGWPARCADDLRGASRLVAWIGSREPRFVRRLTALIPGAVVAPTVGSGRELVWRHLLDTVGASGAADTVRAPVGVPVLLADQAQLALRRIGWDGHPPLVVVHPGAGARGKRWPTAGFAAVVERLARTHPELSVVAHQGPADADAVGALSARLGRRVMLLEEPPLPLLAGALSLATAYLGNDSGVSHLAAALGVPAVVLFTPELVAWQPWAEHIAPQIVSIPTMDEADVVRVVDALRPRLG